MNRRTKSFVAILALSFSLLGCANMKGYPKELKISDVKGRWENTNFGYHYLEINENGKGYLIATLSGEYYENYRIDSIELGTGVFVLHLNRLGDKEGSLVVKGSLIGNDIMNLKNEEDDDSWILSYFIRISKADELREKSKIIISDYESNGP